MFTTTTGNRGSLIEKPRISETSTPSAWKTSTARIAPTGSTRILAVVGTGDAPQPVQCVVARPPCRRFFTRDPEVLPQPRGHILRILIKRSRDGEGFRIFAGQVSVQIQGNLTAIPRPPDLVRQLRRLLTGGTLGQPPEIVQGLKGPRRLREVEDR